MNTKDSAGMLMCRVYEGYLQYFLVHPGGPFFRKKDAGYWSIPKGLPEPGEELLEAAKREFFEETGLSPTPPFHKIGTIKQKGGKVVHAWAFTGTWDPASGIECNTFSLEWPPRSGMRVEFPEVDKADWFTFEQAAEKINAAQLEFLIRAKQFFKTQE